ncbi:hypothetical protein BLA29_008868, partial [Euroglyphus maynei]
MVDTKLRKNSPTSSSLSYQSGGGGQQPKTMIDLSPRQRKSLTMKNNDIGQTDQKSILPPPSSIGIAGSPSMNRPSQHQQHSNQQPASMDDTVDFDDNNIDDYSPRTRMIPKNSTWIQMDDYNQSSKNNNDQQQQIIIGILLILNSRHNVYLKRYQRLADSYSNSILLA